MPYENITKYLKNVSGKIIKCSDGDIIPPEQVIPVTNDMFFHIIKDDYILSKIETGDIKVSRDGVNFFGDNLNGLIYLINRFDDGGNVIWNDNIITISPTIRQDRKTGVKATSLALSLFQILKDFYNDPLNPLYTGPDYETIYWDNVPKLQQTVQYIEDTIKKETYKRPRRIIIQDGSHTKEHLLKFDIIIFNDVSDIIDEIKSVKPTTVLFGMVSNTLSLSNFTTAVDNFSDSIDGIFIEKSGYDNGTVGTNSREATNSKIDYVHNLDKVVMLDAENVNHINGNNNDTSFPNSTWNSDLIESSFKRGDWYLINNFVLNNGTFIDKDTWLSDMNEIFQMRYDIDINLCGICDTPSNDPESPQKYHTACMAAAITALDAAGDKEGIFYERGENPLSNVIMWDKYPKIIVEDGYIRRYFEGATMSIDFSTTYNHSIEQLL